MHRRDADNHASDPASGSRLVRRGRAAALLFGAFAATLSLLSIGCQAPRSLPHESLFVTTRAATAGDFLIHRYEFGADGAPRETQFPARAQTPPRVIALRADGAPVFVSKRSSGAVFGVCGLRDSSRSTERLLDSGSGRLLLLNNINVQPSTPLMYVERGVIRGFTMQAGTLSEWDVEAWNTVGDTLDAWPVAQIRPLRWLMVRGPELLLCDFGTGERSTISGWPSGAHVAAAEALPGSRFVVIAAQMVGRRWNLFDLLVWDRDDNSLRPLLSEPVYEATRPDATLGPTISLRAINERHIAFVATRVTAWRDQLATEGEYATMIADVESRKVLGRIPHRSGGLEDVVPPPLLNAEKLAALRVSVTAPDGVDGAPQRWSSFLALTNGRLITSAGVAYEPDELSEYAYSSDGAALAVRQRSAGANGDNDRCLVLVGKETTISIPVANIEALGWLPPR